MHNNKLFAFTLDLEPEYAGQINQHEIFKDRTKIEEIISTLSSHDIKITVFVVGELFKLNSDIIKLFEKYNCEFEIHSYSHKTLNVNHENEIVQAKKAYFDYFKKDPTGYRVPCGKLTKKIVRLLEKHSFLYDSSTFPSYYPHPLRYIHLNRNIHYFDNSNLMEIPLTSITPIRLTLSLSYLKLLSINFYFWLFRLFKLPDFICFDTHLHDFIINEESHKKLPRFWKFVYNRNKFSGLDYCIQFLKYIKREGYKFCFMSELYKIHKEQILHLNKK